MRLTSARSLLLLIFLGTVATFCRGQSPENQEVPRETQVHGYWIDPAIGLMWAGKDNGKDVSWKKAMRYCRDLHLAGDSDWRLANIGELQGIYDSSANSLGENPRSRWHDSEPMTFHVKGNLFLTGNQWSSTRRYDDRGHPSGYAWRFDFNESMRAASSAVTRSGSLPTSMRCACAAQ